MPCAAMSAAAGKSSGSRALRPLRWRNGTHSPTEGPALIPVRAYLNLLRKYLRPLRRRMTLLGVVILADIALRLANPQLIRSFIDNVVEGVDPGDLIPIAAWFIAIAVVQQVMAVWATYLAEDVGWSATNSLRSDLADHVVRLDLGFHKAHSPGELIERIDGDVTNLSNFFSAMSLKVVGNGLLIVGVLTLLFFESWAVGVGVTAFTVLALLAMIRLHKVAVPWWKSVRAAAATTYGFVGEQVEGTEDITANGASGFMQERFAGMLRSWLPLEVRGWMGFALLWSTNVILFGVFFDHRVWPRFVAVWLGNTDYRIGVSDLPLLRDEPAAHRTDQIADGRPAESRSSDRTYRGAACHREQAASGRREPFEEWGTRGQV